ncbi:hypothetical protein Tco_0082471 [Tanacetum coccineum]
MSEITELQSVDRRRQRAMSNLIEIDRMRREEMRELRATDRTRQQQIIQTLTVIGPSDRLEKTCVLRGQRKSELLPSDQLEQMILQNQYPLPEHNL